MNELQKLVEADDAVRIREREQAKERKRQQRLRVSQVGGPRVYIQIELSADEADLLRKLERAARDPKDFRRLSLLQGAKFRANTGRGRDKFTGRKQKTEASSDISSVESGAGLDTKAQAPAPTEASSRRSKAGSG